MVDNTIYDSQIVTSGAKATAPISPTKDGNNFFGWSVDGVNLVNVSSYIVFENTTFVAAMCPKTATLSKTAFSNAFSSTKSTVTSISFDYYTNYNQYIVDGVNVIDGTTGTTLDENNAISLYENGTNYYILSNSAILLEDLSSFFSGFAKLTSITFDNFDTSNVTSMSYMFSGCQALTTLDLSNFNTSKVTSMSYMFNVCQALITLDLSNFDTSLVTSMSRMFNYCKALTTLNITSFDTSKVEFMIEMFSGCDALTVLDLSSFNTSLVTDMERMFLNCTSLTTIYANEGFSTEAVEDYEYMFKNCTSLVGAISYDGKKTGCGLANYTTGYFTYKAKS